MNKRIQLLIDALLSNEYQQATGALRTDEGWCCLGVGCDVYLKHAGDEVAEWNGDTFFARAEVPDWDGEQDSQTTEMPAAVRDWFGFSSGDGQPRPGVDLPDNATSLIILNDGEDGVGQRTFAEIAEILRRLY